MAVFIFKFYRIIKFVWIFILYHHNHGKLNATSISDTINKAFDSYNSFYALLGINNKARPPKYLHKDDLYTLTFAKLIRRENVLNIFPAQYIADNYDKIVGNNFVRIDKNKYIDKKYLTKIDKKVLKKDNYIYDDFYVNKQNEHIINSKCMYLNIPKYIQNKEIKTVSIIFVNDHVKICYCYINNNNIEKTIINPAYNESISIDPGVKNLLTIHDPTGKQHIISGKFLLSTNHYFKKHIGDAQRKKNKILVNKLNFKRINIINNYFNNIVKWMANTYSDKKLIIMGLNDNWKNKCNIGKDNNYNFYKIPHALLFNKIKMKFTNMNIIVQKIEESYTSKCDTLSNEPICHHDDYNGKRIKRGLFSSKTGKLINADVNGAINIMKKIFPITEIIGINIFNPVRINIFHEVQPVNNSVSAA